MIAFTILGQPYSKSNRRRLVLLGKRIVPVKSKEALAYEKAALAQIPSWARQMLTEPVRVTMRIYYSSHLPDLDESVILDVLQAQYRRLEGVKGERVLVHAGVYVNDRQVREKHIFHGIDKTNPRAEIEVEQLEAALFETLPPVTDRKHVPLRPQPSVFDSDPF